jgi:hypothetical protein
MNMIVRAIDVNHDWTYGQGLNDYKSANLAVAQTINTRLNSFVGDCFFDANAGIDWFNFLGNKDQTGLNLAISAVIINTTNVTGILQLSIVLNDVTRNLTIQYQVQTTYSVTQGSFVYDAGGSISS